ncbi:MAG TPA: amino acid adenylation domain-containing protein, partial [Saprospiraceae bacterium]|nr:amino acid adenylation domain-containing protein [Saprospiraceae bacterium]
QVVHQDQVSAQLYQDLPFERLVNELGVERDASRHPIFQVMFELQSFGNGGNVAEGWRKYFKSFQESVTYEVEKFDLSITIDDREELTGQISYATSLFHDDTITKLIAHYQHLLEQLTNSPDEPYSRFNLLTPEDYDQLVYGWNGIEKEYPNDRTIHDLFQEQALRTPGKMALVYEEDHLTYKDLNSRSNQLARHIRARYRERSGKEMEPDTLIALCLDRSLEMVVGILGVLKAGGAYVPIDPTYPQERIDYMLADTRAELVLVQREREEPTVLLPEGKLVYIGLGEDLYKIEDSNDLPPHSKSTDLAYVIYTSGTTGKPKGAMIEHVGMINHMVAMINECRIDGTSHLAQNAPQSFDICVWQMLTCLTCGGRTTIYGDDLILDTSKFVEKISSDEVTVLEVVPSYLATLLDELDSGKGEGIFKSLKCLVTTGEALKHDLVSRWFEKFPSIFMVNAYGPTEVSDDISLYVMDKTPDRISIPIGRPLQNLSIYIVDSFGEPCPRGVIGEIWVSGIGVGRGYLNNEEKTRNAFMRDPFIKDKSVRLYKTGDLGRWLSDGNLEYMGRNDEQVKVRGFRIELGEIEHALTGIAGIKQSCVLAKERKTDAGDMKYLVGYYVLDEEVTQATILEQLSKVLPEYMVPAALVEMESFPLTINGKLDKHALPDPAFASKDEGYVEPSNEIEKIVAKIWQDVLGLDRVGVTDDFFRIGGDSILSIQVCSRIRRSGFQCQVKDIFD